MLWLPRRYRGKTPVLLVRHSFAPLSRNPCTLTSGFSSRGAIQACIPSFFGSTVALGVAPVLVCCLNLVHASSPTREGTRHSTPIHGTSAQTSFSLTSLLVSVILIPPTVQPYTQARL